MKQTVHFETLGCRLNQDETEGAARSFSLQGFSCDLEAVSARTPVSPDVVLCVVNTCTVTAKAEQKGRRIIRLLLEKFPASLVVVTGCYAELAADEISAMEQDRIAVLPGTKKFLLQKIACEMNGGMLDCGNGSCTLEHLKQIIGAQSFVPADGREAEPGALNSFALYTPVFARHSRATLKVQDGCSNCCSFCRIHLARGPSVSLGVQEAVRRAQELESLGVHEAVLSGVNLSQYAGKGSAGETVSFCGLLSVLLKETESLRFRISSFYPQHITEELCSVLHDRRIQPFFHLSIQSGSSRILRLMNRPYAAADVLAAAARLRGCKENPFISCDIIAGFPGESEADFEETKQLCRELQFAWIHAFPFSPRPGTAAYSMRPQVPERIKGERVQWLTEAAVAGKISYIMSCKGREYDASVEKILPGKQKPGEPAVYHAVTENFLHAVFESPGMLKPGISVRLKIGEPLEESIRAGKEAECTGELSGIV